MTTKTTSKQAIAVDNTFSHSVKGFPQQVWSCQRLADAPNGKPIVRVIAYSMDEAQKPYQFETETEWFTQRGLRMAGSMPK